MRLSRRSLLRLLPAGLLLPRPLLAAPAPGQRKFLFVFCPGGWDQSALFAPVFNDAVTHLAGDEAAQIGDVAFTDAPTRPSVRSFLTAWGDRTCFLNGFQVPSLAHDVCRRLTMTASLGGDDDWVSIIAGNADASVVIPNVHLSGPIYPVRYPNASIRVGTAGQLPGLITGDALSRSDTPVTAPGADVQALEEAFVRARADAWAAKAGKGEAARVGVAEQLALDRAGTLVDVAGDLVIDDPDDFYSIASVAVRCLAAGLSRTGIAAYGLAGSNGRWDTHSGNNDQDALFEGLFSALGKLVADLDALPGESAPTLLEETTVVVLSEMGRTPENNGSGGKDHWTWTSAMLVGSGIRGGRTYGGWTDTLGGQPLDVASGEVSDSGVTLGPGHLGATLLALADIDPGEFVPEEVGTVIEGMIER